MPNTKRRRLARARRTARTARRNRKRRNRRTQKSRAIVRIERPQILAPASPPMRSMVPKIQETVRDLEQVRRFISACLNLDQQRWEKKNPFPINGTPEQKKDWEIEHKALEVDWGTIPGNDKPFLMQPGAEKFLFWLELKPHYTKQYNELGDGHVEIISSVVLQHKRTKEDIFEGPDCSCSTMETNFRYVWAEKQDPCTCSSFPCKGCPGGQRKEELKAVKMGMSRQVNEWRRGKIVGKRWAWFERVDNPNIHNERNKVRQIGQKRALVKGVRGMGALSEIFTQPPDEWDIPEEREDTPETDMDYTDGGRKIYVDGRSPSGRSTDPDARHRTSVRDLDESAAHGHAPGSEKATQAEASLRRVEQADQELKSSAQNPPRGNGGEEAGKTPPKDGVSTPPPRGTIIVDCKMDDKGIVVRGDLTDIGQDNLEKCGAAFRDGWWRIAPSGIAAVFAMCKALNYKFEKIGDATPPPPPKSSARSQQAEASGTGEVGRGQSPKASSSAPPPVKLVTGMIEDYHEKTSKVRKTPFLAVLVKTKAGNEWYECWSKTIFQLVYEAKRVRDKGQDCVLVIDKIQIKGFRRIGQQEYDDDGRTKVMRVHREPGKTLFP